MEPVGPIKQIDPEVLVLLVIALVVGAGLAVVVGPRLWTALPGLLFPQGRIFAKGVDLRTRRPRLKKRRGTQLLLHELMVVGAAWINVAFLLLFQ